MTAASTYDKGDLVRCTGQFTDEDGHVVDPGTVTFKVKDPTGTVTTKIYGTDAAVVRDSAGNYHCDVSVTATGDWFFRWESTGTGQAAGESWFMVRASNF